MKNDKKLVQPQAQMVITLNVFAGGVECKVSQPINSLVLADILMTTASNALKAILNQNSMLVGKKDGPTIITAEDAAKREFPETEGHGDAS